MGFIVILAIFLVPIASIVSIKGTVVWYPQLLALQFVGGLCFASQFWRLNKFLSIFLAYLVFSYVYVTSANSRTLLCLMIGYAAISVTLLASRIKNLKWVYISLTGISLLSIIYSIVQATGHDPIFVPIGGGREDVVSFMGSRNQLGIYSAASAFWAPCLLPLATIPIFLAKCNSAFIGLFSGAIVYSYSRHGWKAMCIVLLVVSLVAVPWWHFNAKSGTEIKERFSIWRLTASQAISGKTEDVDLQGHRTTIQANPWFGFGLGDFFVYSPFSQYKIWDLSKTYQHQIPHYYEHAHNDLLEALYEFGYAGFLVIVFCAISVVRLFVSCPIKTSGVVLTFSSLVAQSVSSFSVYVFHCPVSLFMFCLTLGLFYKEVENAKPSKIVEVAKKAVERTEIIRRNDGGGNISSGIDDEVPAWHVPS